MDSNTTSLQDFYLDAFGINTSFLKEREVIDVSNSDVEVEGFDHSRNCRTFGKVLRVTRKKDGCRWTLTTETGKQLSGSSTHLVCVKLADEKLDTYLSLRDLKKLRAPVKIFTADLLWESVASVVKTKEKVAIFDMLVDKVHNYFSNGLLSHNTFFGNPERTTGGNALKFYSSVRLDIRKVEAIKSGDDVVGNKVKIKVVKNKVAPPFKECLVDIIFGKGISKEGDVLELAIVHNVIEKSGSWFSYNGKKIGQGSEAVLGMLKKDPLFFEEVRQKVQTEMQK